FVLELSDQSSRGAEGSSKLRSKALVQLIGKLKQSLAVSKHFTLTHHCVKFSSRNTDSISKDIESTGKSIAQLTAKFFAGDFPLGNHLLECEKHTGHILYGYFIYSSSFCNSCEYFTRFFYSKVRSICGNTELRV